MAGAASQGSVNDNSDYVSFAQPIGHLKTFPSADILPDHRWERLRPAKSRGEAGLRLSHLVYPGGIPGLLPVEGYKDWRGGVEVFRFIQVIAPPRISSGSALDGRKVLS